MKYLVMAALCLFLTTKVQSQNTAVAVKPVRIGQMLPEVMLRNIHNYKTKTADMADFGAKLIILDFWATWCSPCVAMIPKLDSLQKEYQNDIQILSVTYQSQQEVLPFLEKLEKQKGVHYQIPVITDDKELRYLFPHQTLPHYVWISANGTVKAITGMEEITAENIDQFLDGKALKLATKKDTAIRYNTKMPFLINGNGGEGTGLIYHSILSGYTEGLPSQFHAERGNDGNTSRLVLTNSPIIWLYKIAYGNGYTQFFQQNKIAVEVSHPEELNSALKGKAYMDWLQLPGHGICYELKLPAALSGQFYQVMQDNLKLLFPQYTAVVEERKVKAMALVRLSGADRIRAADPSAKVVEKFDPFGFTLQNSTLNSLLCRLQMQYQQASKMPFVDETGYEGRVDLNITANLSSIADMNRALKAYNLQWKEKEVKIRMLVIRDSI